MSSRYEIIIDTNARGINLSLYEAEQFIYFLQKYGIKFYFSIREVTKTVDDKHKAMISERIVETNKPVSRVE